MKEIIKSVLSRYKNSQINLASDSSVDLIASEIEEAVLVKNKYVQKMIKDSFEEEN